MGGAAKAAPPVVPFVTLNNANLSASRTAFRNARTGVANMFALYMGDSTMRGYQGTSGPSVNNPFTAATATTGQLPSLALSVPQFNESMFGADNGDMNATFDSRYFDNFNNAPVTLNALGGQTFNNTITGREWVMNTPSGANRIDVYYISATGSGNGNFDVHAFNGATDLGLLGTLSCNQANAQNKATFTLPATTGAIQLLADSASIIYITGVVFYKATAPGLHHINAGLSASVAAYGADTTSAWSSLFGIGVVAPHLVFINYCINDASAGTAQAAYQASLLAMVNAARSAGANPVFLTGNPVGTALAPATQVAYVNFCKSVAAANNVPVLDTFGMFGTFAAMQANAFTSDTGLIHPNTLGYAQEATLVNAFIKNFIAN